MHIPFITRVVPFLFPFLEPHFGPSHSPPPDRPRTLTFQPIHAHSHTFSNSSTKPRLFFHNASAPTTCLFVPDSGSVEPEVGDETNLLDNPSPKLAASPLTIRTTPITVRRPRIRPPSISSWAISARNQQHITINISESWVAPDYADDKGDWEDVEVLGPDIRDRQTLLALAKMSSNAYTIPDGGEWWPVDGWNETMPFGWEPDSDGLRGHVFADPTNSTVIISIKGTSAGVFGVGGPTAKNDKFNNLYNNVTYMYPNATIWMVGHSLGGAVSGLIGLSFGAPVVTFEAPGERLAAQRLHLPLPPGMPSDMTGITHIYHTADPIPMGTCTGTYSGCYAAGFALESKCHTGQTILYDTVTVKGWSVDVRTHRIGEIINKILVDPWPGTEGDPGKPEVAESSWSWWGWGRKGPGRHRRRDGPEDEDDGWNKHGGVPEAEPEDECIDCFKWEYGDGWSKKILG